VPILNAANSLRESAAHSKLSGAAGQPSAAAGSPAPILLSTINAKWIHPSLALRLLKANLGDLETRCEILEFALRQPLAEKIGPIIAAGPRILGLSVSIWNHRATVELLRALQDRTAFGTAAVQGRRPGGKPAPAGKPIIVLGGPEVSHLTEDAEIFRYADFVIRGEGETTFRELCAGILEGRTLPPGKFIQAPPVDPAAIDPGYRLYRDEDLTRKLVYVEASRGCPFGCEFCLSSLDRTVREFPLEQFLADMEYLAGRGARTFKFLDRSFNLDTERARRIMAFFLDKAEAYQAAGAAAGPPFCVHFEMIPGRFPAELRSLLQRFPPETLRLEIGVQTLNRKTAALVNRTGDPETALETLRFLRRETGAIIHADLIAGLPGEGMASFGEGFDRLWEALSAGPPAAGHPPSGPRPVGSRAMTVPAASRTEIQLGILKRLPGAPIVRHDGPCGMRYDPAPPYEVRETAALSAGELDRITNFARFWELIVNRNAFPDLVPALFPPGKPVWDRFMALSDRLLVRFGRNWGIDRRELRTALEEAHPPV
jgi:hypothetical protein